MSEPSPPDDPDSQDEIVAALRVELAEARASVLALRAQLSADPEDAAALALKAWSTAPNADAAAALRQALNRPLVWSWRALDAPLGPIATHGEWVAVAEAQSPRTLSSGPRVRVRHLQSGHILRAQFQPGALTDLAFRPSSRADGGRPTELLASLAHLGIARLDLEAGSWRTLGVTIDATVERLLPLPLGRHVVAGTSRGDILVLDLDAPGQGVRHRTGTGTMISALALDDRWLWAGDKAGQLWRLPRARLLEDGEEPAPLGELGGAVVGMTRVGTDLAVLTTAHLARGSAQDLDLDLLAIEALHAPASALVGDGADALWTGGTGPCALAHWSGHTATRVGAASGVGGLAGRPTGVVSAHADGVVRGWTPGGAPRWAASAPPPEQIEAEGAEAEAEGAEVVATSPAGDLRAVGGPGGHVHVEATATGEAMGFTAAALGRDPAGRPEAIAALAFSRDARSLWILPRTGPAWVAPVGGGVPRQVPRPPGAASGAVAWAPDGETLLVGIGPDVVGIVPWTGEVRGRLSGSGAEITALAVDLAGTTVWAGDADGSLRPWSLRTQQPYGDPVNPGLGAVHSIDWAPGADQLVATCRLGSTTVLATTEAWASAVERQVAQAVPGA